MLTRLKMCEDQARVGGCSRKISHLLAKLGWDQVSEDAATKGCHMLSEVDPETISIYEHEQCSIWVHEPFNQVLMGVWFVCDGIQRQLEQMVLLENN